MGKDMRGMSNIEIIIAGYPALSLESFAAPPAPRSIPEKQSMFFQSAKTIPFCSMTRRLKARQQTPDNVRLA